MPLTADCYDCRRRRAAVAGQQLVAIVDPRAAKLVTGRHWIEDDGAARLEATEKGIVERRGDCYEFRGCGKIRSPGKIKYLRDSYYLAYAASCPRLWRCIILVLCTTEI